MQRNVSERFQEMAAEQQETSDRIEQLLAERSPGTQGRSTMSYCRVASIKRFQTDNQAYMQSVASFYAVAAKLGVRVVLLWTAWPDERLTLDLGVETSYAQDVSRALSDQVRGITFSSTDFPDAWKAEDSLWGMDGICCGPEIPGIDSALSGLRPGNALLLVLNPALSIKDKMKRCHQAASRVSLYQSLNMQFGRGKQVSNSTNSTHGRTRGVIATHMESSNRGETRTRSSGSSSGSNTGANMFLSVGSNHGNSMGASVAETTGMARGENNGTTDNTSDTSGTTQGQTDTGSENRTYTATFSNIAMAIRQLANRCARYLRGISTGMVSAAVYCFASETKARVVLAQVNGLLKAQPVSGSVADDVFSEIRRAGNTDSLIAILGYGTHPTGFGKDCLPTELPCFLPSGEKAGVNVDFTAEYARNIVFSDPSGAAPVRIGRIMEEDRVSNRPALLDSNALNEHMLFCGATGCGKSTAITNLVCQVLKTHTDVHFLAIDPKDTLKPQDFLRGATVYVTRADSNANILRLQPFAVPKGISLSTHIDRLSSLFQSCWSMSAAMPDILRQALTLSYLKCGWDLNHNIRIRVPGMPEWPTFSLLESMTRQVIKSGGFSDRTRLDYEGALLTRLHTMSTNTCAQIFRENDAIPFEALFNENAIIHCQSLSGETLSLTMSLLLLQLNEFRSSVAAGRRNLKLQHITIFEEAHHLAPRTPSRSDSLESVNIGGKSTEAIAVLLAEARDKGECCILSNQTIHEISQSAIDNTASKIIFQIAGKDDIEDVVSALALNTAPAKGINQALGLARLCKYEALVYQRDWNNAPVKVRMDDNPLATNTADCTAGTAEAKRQWIGQVLEALILPDSEAESRKRLAELWLDETVAPQLRHDAQSLADACLNVPVEMRPAGLRRLLLLFFDGMTDVLMLHFSAQPDRLFQAVLDSLPCYADVSGLSPSDRSRLAQEILVGEKERGKPL